MPFFHADPDPRVRFSTAGKRTGARGFRRFHWTNPPSPRVRLSGPALRHDPRRRRVASAADWSLISCRVGSPSRSPDHAAGHAPNGGPGSWYGYGTIIEEKRGVRSYGHGGTAPGTQFELRIFPDLDTVMVVMSNYNTIAAH